MVKRYSLSINTLSIQIIEKGNQQLPAILFLHGNSSSSRIWQKQFESKLFENYRLIAFDLPGHGLSSSSNSPEKDYNVLGYIVVLKEIVTRLQLKQYLLVGFSLGGHISIEALPEMISCKGVFVAGTPPAENASSFFQALLPNPYMGSFYKEVTKTEVELITRVMLRKEATHIPSFLKEDFLKTNPNARIYLHKGVTEGKYLNELSILQEAKVPIAVVSGADEQLLNNDYLTKLTVPLWRHGAQMIPEAGHIVPYENSDCFNELLGEFAKEVFE